ncbi:GH92 family glycosyl hydrolase [Cellulomonas sp. PhB143]|uniref:GH92 family glycosyl hydrolase n=1 Tax=Cellulomonas sp. PhB143 TaxID=2485186 RepID=UPI000F468EF5|nr:GH92 family glycosyl hydrolase [Cellulomonas sp. PhB143]ROS79206.1 putative alpha-1,2-mannosidase [Cellulomonas sp. PhB143]
MALPLVPLGAAAATAAPAAPAALPAAAAEPGDWSTSFEKGDPAPLVTTVAQRDGKPWQSNVTGTVSTLPGSVVGQVAEVTASDQNLPNEGVANLTDGSPSTKWLTFHSTGWATYRFADPVRITAYTLTSAGDAEERDPKAWTVQGSNDGTTWTTVDQRSGQDFPDRLQTKTFEAATPGEYTYYRLDVTANNSGSIVQLADWDVSTDLDAPPTESPMVTELSKGPASGPTIKSNVGFTGLAALRYGGSHLDDGDANATNVLYDGLDVVVGEDSRLSYEIFPDLLSDLQYPSTYAAIDVRFTDGTYLSGLGARDQNETPFSPRGEGAGKILYANQWNDVQVDLTKAAGKTIDQVLLGYDNPGGEGDTRFQGWVDDVAVTAHPEAIDGSSRTHYVDTRRGTFATGGFSRGNNIPASAVPNGFNFWTPMTDAGSQSWLYAYQQQNNAQNVPVMQGIGASHEPSPWMGDRNQLAFLPAEGGGVPDATLAKRGLPFSHDDETAQPDYYGVTFANGISAEVAPTDHAAVLRFTYDTAQGQVLMDKVAGDAKLSVDAAGTVSGWVDGGSGLSAGRSRMFVSGTFDRAPSAVGTAAGDRTAARYATFDTSSTKSVELRVATSFISQAQATKNLDLEVTGRSFHDVRAAAQQQWNDRLGVIDVEGANEDKLVTLYSNLYRLNLYPNSQFENTGSAGSPTYRYASPVAAKSGTATDTTTNAKIVDGKIYVNNGFWDTYRTAWPAYSLLYPDVAEELVGGFVQQYRDSGWVARWSSPGYADLMTGTSSDVAFADAYAKGALPTDVALEAYDAALKNATVKAPNIAVGRKGLDSSIFLGYTPSSTGESVSWGLEGLVNDYGIGTMAAKLAEDPATPEERRAQLREESTYFLERSTHYVNLFDPSIGGFFQARNADGTFQTSPEDYDPKDWGGPYTETSGWNFAFHAPQDGQGLANLYGGKQGLEDKLDEFFSTPETAPNGGIHERLEARDVRMGQWGMSNQVSHHIPYMYDYAGAPAKAQEKVRETLRRLFVGSSIGQGYPGDEDNGEMSSWWLLSSLGIYPLQVGSENYAIGSPQFTKATVHIPGGDLVVDAPDNSVDNVYVQDLKVDGVEHSSTSISQEDLVGGHTLTFDMGSEPSSWGTGADDAPVSLTKGDEAPEPVEDVTGADVGKVTVSDGTAAKQVTALTDDTSATQGVLATGTPAITWKGSGVRPTVTQYTLTSGSSGAAPSAWTLEGSNDGESWTTLDDRSGETFRWASQTRPFVVAEPASYAQYRVTVGATAGDGALTLSELELLADPAATATGDLTLTAAGDMAARTGEELDAPLATLTGLDGSADDVTASVTFGDGSDPVEGSLGAGKFGAFTVSAPHTFDEPGVYPVTVTVTQGDQTLTATLQVTVSLVRENALVAAFDSTCIGDVGSLAANCDYLGNGFDRAQLAAKGFVQGERVAVPGTALSFDLPARAPGEPDNATGAGQTIELDLPDDATQISVIGTANEKSQQAQGTVTFADGSTAPIDTSFGDWSGTVSAPVYGNVLVAGTERRMSGTGTVGTPAGVFAAKPFAIPAGKDPVSITLPTQTGTPGSGRIHVFAIASDGTVPDRAPLAATAGKDLDVAVGEPLDDAVLATVTGGRATAGAPLRASVTWGDGSDKEPATVTAADSGDATVTGSHTYAAKGTYVVSVVVDDGWESSVARLTVTVGDAAPVLLVDTTAVARCVGANAYVAVRATNGEGVPLAITLTTPFGAKSFDAVAPGKSASQSFNARVGTLEPGTVTVKATGTVGGEEVTTTSDVAYDAVTCR